MKKIVPSAIMNLLGTILHFVQILSSFEKILVFLNYFSVRMNTFLILS